MFGVRSQIELDGSDASVSGLSGGVRRHRVPVCPVSDRGHCVPMVFHSVVDDIPGALDRLIVRSALPHVVREALIRQGQDGAVRSELSDRHRPIISDGGVAERQSHEFRIVSDQLVRGRLARLPEVCDLILPMGIQAIPLDVNVVVSDQILEVGVSRYLHPHRVVTCRGRVRELPGMIGVSERPLVVRITDLSAVELYHHIF